MILWILLSVAAVLFLALGGFFIWLCWSCQTIIDESHEIIDDCWRIIGDRK